MTTLAQLVDTLGPAIVETVVAADGVDVQVTGVIVHERSDPFEIRPGDLVIGVGLDDEDERCEDLLAAAAERGAAAVAVKTAALAESPATRAKEAGVPLLSIPQGASWAQIIYLVQSVLSHGNFAHDDEELGGLPAGDLFALADAIAALIGAPVTIEDRLSRVLAFSADQQAADAARMETVLGRRVPERYLTRLEEFGVFKRLIKGQPVYVEGFEKDMLARFVAPVHAGDELLGSIWAAVKDRPTREHEGALIDAAKLTALHLLRHRAGLDLERSLQADLLAAILEGGGAARESAERLGLREGGYRVLAATARGSNEVYDESLDTRLRDVLTVHLSRVSAPGAAAVLGGLVFGIVSCGARNKSQERARRIARGFLAASGFAGERSVLAGIGGHAQSLSDVPRSRREAEESLRVVRAGRYPETVATIEDVRVQVLLTRFEEFAAEDRELYEAKLKGLRDSDNAQRTSYVATLRAYLEAFGDVNAAAQRLHVHPNTVRYRVRKAQEISGIRLKDHSERLALMLWLSVFASDS